MKSRIRKWSLLALSIRISLISCLAQPSNLVPNASFEQLAQQPKGYIVSPLQFDSCAVDWEVVNLTTPDIVANSFFPKSVAKYFGTPHQGAHMLGLGNTTKSFTEYASCKLITPLAKGQTYKATFWVRLARATGGTLHFSRQLLNTSFGLLLSTEKIFHYNGNMISAKPQVTADSEGIWVDDQEWTPVEAIFKAEQAYTHLTIGQFFDDSAIVPLLINGYVLIDDISIVSYKESYSLNPPVISFEEQVFFQSGSSEIAPQYFSTLDTIVSKLKQTTEGLDLIGHTDDIGSTPSNFKLAAQRAKAVYDYLIAKGVDSRKLLYYGMGDWMAKSGTAKATNRRVEFRSWLIDTVPSVTPKDVYRFSSEIEADAAYPTWEYTFIGAYEKALSARAGKTGSTDNLPQLIDSLSLSLIDAKDYILRQAAHQQAVFFNEAHHIPQHRFFVTHLLKDLYALGYRYLGLEALTDATTLIENNYPTLAIGYYTREPLMAELLREAMKLGFQVFGYEATNHQQRYLKQYLAHQESNPTETIEVTNPDGTTQTMNLTDWNIDRNARELAQAINIQNIFAHDPTAKLLIHAGFGHIKEATIAGWEPMAAQFKKITAIDPLTIDQTKFPAIEQPYITSPTILTDAAQQPYILPDFDPTVATPYVRTMDMHVITPYTNSSDKHWLLTTAKRKFSLKEIVSAYDCPCLVHVYATDEPISKAVPIMVVEYSHKQPTPVILPPGKYRLLVRDQKDQVGIEAIVVD
ncbi:MAG: OmpA family protein [Bacteroidota bacterium]